MSHQVASHTVSAATRQAGAENPSGTGNASSKQNSRGPASKAGQERAKSAKTSSSTVPWAPRPGAKTARV
ncbi:MAG: hypothetical protein Kow0073_14850 [Immundisolibacter sp.]